MSTQVTEIAYLPLKEGLDLEDKATKAVFDEAFATIARQPGLISIFWGRQIENPDTAQMVIDWASMNDHKTFQSTPEYAPFLTSLSPYLSSPPTLYHASIPPLPAGSDNPLLQPVTECINAYFPPSYSTTEYLSSFATFSAEAAEVPNITAKGLVGGFAAESVQHEGLGEGVEGRLFAAFIGWPSVDEHLEFRKTEAFGKIAWRLRGGAKAVKVWHVAFTQVK